MITNNLGYIFECRKDCQGNYGVMLSYKVLNRDNNQNVSLVCAIDASGGIITPAYNDLSTGFKPLSNFCETEEDLQRFMKSNKPYFAKLGEFAMLVAGTIVFNKETGELISTKDMKFYVPKTISLNVADFGDNVPALICDMVDVKKGLNVFEISEPIYQGYIDKFLEGINKDNTETKFKYLSSLILKEA